MTFILSLSLFPVQILFDLAVQNSDSDYLIRALALLTRLHEASPSNFKAMLMTVKIFHWLGFAPNASQVYETIEPKVVNKPFIYILSNI